MHSAAVKVDPFVKIDNESPEVVVLKIENSKLKAQIAELIKKKTGEKGIMFI